jgi:carbonic anhydrase/acetyltransferase-like protein (isoleucine patch superfamily)
LPIYALDDKKPELPPEGRYWIAPSATIIGDVVLHEDVGIWFGAVLRGDNERLSIGARSNIQEGVTLHTDAGLPLWVGEGCTIGHNAILHSCRIGDNSLIGMGAIVLNGATVGRNCLVGAGALLTENKTFADGSLIVGSPAKAVRALDDAAIETLRASAKRYIENWRRYARELKPIG